MRRMRRPTRTGCTRPLTPCGPRSPPCRGAALAGQLRGAFSYLARDLGLRELYLWPINADQMGTPKQVRKVIDGVRADRIPVVFCESTVNQAPAQQVARETGASYGGGFVDSLSPPGGPVPSYLSCCGDGADIRRQGCAAQSRWPRNEA